MANQRWRPALPTPIHIGTPTPSAKRSSEFADALEVSLGGTDTMRITGQEQVRRAIEMAAASMH